MDSTIGKSDCSFCTASIGTGVDHGDDLGVALRNPAEIFVHRVFVLVAKNLQHAGILDKGPLGFYTNWIGSALQFDFGDSWRVLTGKPVLELMTQTIPNTLLLILLALIPITVGSVLGAFQRPSKRWDPALLFLSVLPVVVLALLAAAVVELNFAGTEDEGLGYWIRLVAAAFTLGIADGALSGSILGNRSMFEQENQQRYVGISILRGESNFSNTLLGFGWSYRWTVSF